MLNPTDVRLYSPIYVSNLSVYWVKIYHSGVWGGSMGVLMRFVWRSLVWGWVFWVGLGVCLGVWVSEFWTSGIVNTLILTISMSTVCVTQFGQKMD